MTSVRDISRIITKARTRDEEQTEKYDAMVRNLLESTATARAASTSSSSTRRTTCGRTERISRANATRMTDAIFRPFAAVRRRAQRSLRRRPCAAPQEGARVDPREHRRHRRRGIHHRQEPGQRHQGPDPRHQASTASSTATTRRASARATATRSAARSIGKAPAGRAPARTRPATSPASDYYETDVTLEELIDIMFEDLELPDLERKALRQIEASAMSASARATARSASACASTSGARPVNARGARCAAVKHRHTGSLDSPAAPESPGPGASRSTTTT